MNPFFHSSTPTPRLLKILFTLILLTSLFSRFLLPYFGLWQWASNHFHAWQLITYSFLHLFPSELLSLIFNLYILWVFGASLIERMHLLLFLSLYIGASLMGGLCALGIMTLSHHPMVFFGATPPIYALITSWVLLHKETRLLLFFTLPLKASNLLLILIGFSLAIDLSTSHFTNLGANLGAILFGYLFTLLSCKAKSPFTQLASFENRLLRWLEKVKHICKKCKKQPFTRAKIYDFKSGKVILNDEEFMDAMLTRISLYGKETLTAEEQQRMEEISKKKR